jgi:hypothetical protein
MPASWADDLALIPKQMMVNTALQQAAKATSSPAPATAR